MKSIETQVKEIIDEYNEKRYELKKVYDQKLKAICVPYAKEKARFKEGDILKNDIGIIRVERIGASIVGGKVYTTYAGPKLTKALKVRKDSWIELTDFGDYERIVKL